MTKRVLDIVGALLLILLTMPLWILILAAIPLESKGGSFYRSPRIGRGGRLFRMMKFRTMYADGRARLTEQQQKMMQTNFKISEDPRVTPLGRVLRRFSLDELPQLWNVVRGEMSLVGPRPKLPDEIHLYGSSKDELLSVPPGMTGYWQVYRTSANSDRTMRSMDLRYVRTRTILLDLQLLWRTVRVVLKSTNY